MLDVMLVICTKMESENELLLCIHKSTFVRTLNMYFYSSRLTYTFMLGCAFFHTRNATADPTMTMTAAPNMTHPTIIPGNIVGWSCLVLAVIVIVG